MICVVGFANLLYSQGYAVGKGAVIISGTGSFSSSGGELFEDYENNRLTNIALTPGVNYFVGKNFFFGGSVELSIQSQGDYSSTATGIGPQIGYAFGNETSRSFPFIFTGYRYYNLSYEEGDNAENASGTDFIVGLGMIIPVREHIGFMFESGYHIINLKDSENNDSFGGNMFYIGIGISGLLYK